MDLIFPPSARVSSSNWQLISNTAISRSIFTGAVRSLSRSGDRWRVSFNTQNAGRDGETYNTRAALQALRANLRGQANRVWLFDPGYRPRGSFPATELLSNNTFANGTVGWTPAVANLTVADRVARLTVTGTAQPYFLQACTLTQYAPHVMRSFISDGLGSSGVILGPYFGAGSNALNGYSSSRGLRTLSAVTDSTSPENMFPVAFSDASGYSAGTYVECPYASVSRCALVDNGPNLLLRSDEFDNASWTKTALTVSADAIAAPDGTTTADNLVETGATSGHDVTQAVTVSSAAADYSVCVALRQNGRSWAFIQIVEGTGGTGVYQLFDLDSAALGTAASAGANWSNRRAFVKDLGNDWVLCCLVGRKTNAATTLTVQIGAATGDSIGSTSYAGSNGTTAIAAWRATIAQSSVPTRLVQTTSAAVTGTSQTGSALYIKGLPASTNGLLLEGDRFQIGNQLCKVTAALNSDAAGLGYLQFAPALRSSPADNAPVIIHQPMMRAILTEPDGGWSDRPGMFSDMSFEFEEALDV